MINRFLIKPLEDIWGHVRSERRHEPLHLRRCAGGDVELGGDLPATHGAGVEQALFDCLDADADGGDGSFQGASLAFFLRLFSSPTLRPDAAVRSWRA